MNMRSIAGSAIALALMLSGFAVMADNAKDKDKEKDKVRGQQQQTVVVFGDQDKRAARSYWRQTYGRRCPPGLAKKNNGCLPPGIAAKRYAIGQPIPEGLNYHPAPARLVRRLTPAPAGYQYVIVDGDLVRMAVDSRIVADAIYLTLN